MSDARFRLEEDLLGTVEVPCGALWGAQTQRAVLNFPLEGASPIGADPEMARALVAVKSAAADANRRIGALDDLRGTAIQQAARAVIEDELWVQFPVHRLHGGGGTSANMNANEVLANLAEERLGGRRGEYRLVHPNGHVNLNQTTNDVYPTACHLALLDRWGSTQPRLEGLGRELEGLAAQTQAAPRLARTCLQDAVEGTWGDYFGAAASFVRRASASVAESVAGLRAVNLGGGIVGHGRELPAPYRRAVIEALRFVTGDERLHADHDLCDAAQYPDPMVRVGDDLERLARGLVKLAKDLRLLGSGPEGGLGELRLPPTQPGSSAMPGKVNPVIPEFAIQLCLDACGRQAAARAAIDHGELDLNVWESLIVFSTLDAMRGVGSAAAALADRCLRGLEVDETTSRRHAESLIPSLLRLAGTRGYPEVTRLCREENLEPQRIRARLDREGLS